MSLLTRKERSLWGLIVFAFEAAEKVSYFKSKKYKRKKGDTFSIY